MFKTLQVMESTSGSLDANYAEYFQKTSGPWTKDSRVLHVGLTAPARLTTVLLIRGVLIIS